MYFNLFGTYKQVNTHIYCSFKKTLTLLDAFSNTIINNDLDQDATLSFRNFAIHLQNRFSVALCIMYQYSKRK
ncbi:unnamed protein product [Spodoptera exigua]|nr:unnamed protein product [Spodoptera exigua]